MFAGPNGSGKSTLYESLVREEHFQSLPFINPDILQQDLNTGRPIGQRQVPTEAAVVEVQTAMRGSSFPDIFVRVEELEWSSPGIRLRTGARCDGYLAAALAEVFRDLMLAAGQSFGFETVMSDPRKLEPPRVI